MTIINACFFYWSISYVWIEGCTLQHDICSGRTKSIAEWRSLTPSSDLFSWATERWTDYVEGALISSRRPKLISSSWRVEYRFNQPPKAHGQVIINYIKSSVLLLILFELWHEDEMPGGPSDMYPMRVTLYDVFPILLNMFFFRVEKALLKVNTYEAFE